MPGSRGFTEDEAAASAAQQSFEQRRAGTAAAFAARAEQAGRGALDPDVSVPPFAHLTARTCYSMRDGAIRPGELAAAAAAAGMDHVAVVDRDGLYGAVRVARATAAHGVHPVFGTDLALAVDLTRPGWTTTRAGRGRLAGDDRCKARPDDPRAKRPAEGPAFLEDDAARIRLIARTTAGYGDLCRTITAAHTGFPTPTAWQAERDSGAAERVRGAPHLAWEHVEEAAASGGVYALLGADSPVGRLLATGRIEAAAEETRRWMEVFGRDGVLLGVRNHYTAPGRDSGEPGDDSRIRRTLRLAERLEITAVAVNDARYLRPDDAPLADVLRCIRRQVTLGRHHLDRSTAEGWLKPPAAMQQAFTERPDLLAAAHEVAADCEVDLGLGQTQVPRLTGLSEREAAEELRRRCRRGLGDRYGIPTRAVRDRMADELAMVDELGLHDYFLAVADILAAVRGELGVLAACRGSAAGSLVCYALGISDVDPVAHDLAFERFMNPHRDELPDIDLDVESARREDVYDLVMDRYGAEHTACVAMVETFQARSAIREVGKVLGLPGDEIGPIAKSITHARARDIRDVVAGLPELERSRIGAGQLDQLLDLVERIDGFPRHLALHPCGILLADRRLTARTPLERSAPRGRNTRDGSSHHPGYLMAQFDKDDVAALGMLKLDVLGVRILSAMRHAVDEIERVRGHELDLVEIPAGDRDTYELVCTGRTVGIFQIESPGQQELVSRVAPEDLDDLIVEISLFRPGPVKADMVTPFVSRRHGEEPERFPHESLKAVLAETHGVVVYHEQVMRVLAALTGCDLAYADLLRRRLSDDQQVEAICEWALARAAERGFDADEAVEIWRQVASFASFGFCKAHAAAFAVPTYRSAYLKAHFLPELMAGLLTHDPGMYPRRLMLDECRTFGVAVLGADVNRSERDYTVEIIDQDRAEAILGVDPDSIDRDGLPPGWSRPEDPEQARLVPPSGRDAGAAGEARRFAVRVGLKDIRGITDEEIDSLIAARPLTTLADLRDTTVVSRPVAERLAEIGALDELAGLHAERGASNRREIRLLVEELWGRGRRRRDGPEQISLDLHVDEEPQLPEPTEATRVRIELADTGLDVSRHVLSFYEPLLEALGVVRAADLDGLPSGRRVRVAGVKIAVQSPAQRSGQRVLFLSLDDRTGTSQITFFQRTLGGVAWTVLNAWLLVAEGRVSRRGGRTRSAREQQASDDGRRMTRRRGGAVLGGGVTVTGRRAWDLTRLWRAWQESWLQEALAEQGTPAPHERSRERPAGLHAAEFGRGSR